MEGDLSPRNRSDYKALLFGTLLTFIIRLLGCLTRIRVHDKDGFLSGSHPGQFIAAFWHNRMVVMPVIYKKFYKRKGAAVLTSPSREGSMVERVVRSFGMDVVRGSSSRRGTAAVLALKKRMSQGCDVILTPDGPRGPCYKLGAGIVYLSQRSGHPVLPIRVDYSRYIELKSWDRFRIPLPFSIIDVTLEPLIFAKPTESEAAFESERLRLEKAMPW